MSPTMISTISSTIAIVIATFVALLLTTDLNSSNSSTMPSNLLPATITGSVQLTSSILINAPKAKVWNILMDIPSYPSWNPTLRSLTVIDNEKKPLPDQTLRVGESILVGLLMNPTMDPAAKPREVVELVLAVDHPNTRWTYRSHGTGPVFRAERAQALMEVEDGLTQWEIRHTVGGALSPVMGWIYKSQLQLALDEMGKALKKLAESS